LRESTLVLFLKFDKKISPFKASRDFFYVKLSKNRAKEGIVEYQNNEDDKKIEMTLEDIDML